MELEIHGLPDEVVCQSWPVVVEAWGGVRGLHLLRTYLETQVSQKSDHSNERFIFLVKEGNAPFFLNSDKLYVCDEETGCKHMCCGPVQDF